MEKQLSGSHRATYDAIFQHPVSRDLKWADVRAMLVFLAETALEQGDTLKLTRRGKSLVVRRPERSGMGDIGELMKIRTFLAQTSPVVAGGDDSIRHEEK